jgi:hypothetical protein
MIVKNNINITVDNDNDINNNESFELKSMTIMNSNEYDIEDQNNSIFTDIIPKTSLKTIKLSL